MREVDVCVVGAGPVGGTLACLLAQSGVRTAIVDRAALPPMEHPAFDGRAYAIAAGSRAVMQSAGVWDRLPFAPGPIRDIRVSDGKLGRAASRLHLHFAVDDVGAEAFGWMVEARSLRVALNGLMHALPQLELFAPARATVTAREGLEPEPEPERRRQRRPNLRPLLLPLPKSPLSLYSRETPSMAAVLWGKADR